MEMEYALVKKAMRGNPKAFGTLIEARQETMYRIAFLYVRNEADALDVVQESILKAYKNIKSLREPKAFHSWLMRIVTNTAHDLLRQRGKQVPMEENILSSTDSLPLEDKIALHWAIDQLPDVYQELVRQKYFDGRTIQEISRSTGIPMGTVSVYLRRAVKQLQSLLKEESVCEKK